MPCRSVASAAALAVLLAGPLASAHIDLNVPPARHDDPLEDQKDGPCGLPGSPRSADPTVLQPGETVTIQWDETIDHDSHYRLAFLADGEDFPLPAAFDDFCDPAVDDWCVADELADVVDGSYEFDWVVPDTPCDNCTLQLIQVMYDADGLQENDFYYDCADVVILDPDPSTSATTGAGGGGDGGAGDGGSSSGDGGSSSGDGPTGSGSGSGSNGPTGSDAAGAGGGAVASTGSYNGVEPRVFPDEGGCSVAAPGAAGRALLAAPIGLALAALGLRALGRGRARGARSRGR